MQYSELVVGQEKKRDFFTYHERTVGVAVFLGFWTLVVPVLVLLSLLIGSSWMVVLGLHPHEVLWGWLSSKTLTRNGTIWSLAPWIGPYFLIIASVFIIHQAIEGLWAAFRAFKQALS